MEGFCLSPNKIIIARWPVQPLALKSLADAAIYCILGPSRSLADAALSCFKVANNEIRSTRSLSCFKVANNEIRSTKSENGIGKKLYVTLPKIDLTKRLPQFHIPAIWNALPDKYKQFGLIALMQDFKEDKIDGYGQFVCTKKKCYPCRCKKCKCKSTNLTSLTEPSPERQ